MSDHPRRRTGEAHRSFGEEGGLVVRPTRSEIKVLNAVGSTIYAMLDGTNSLDDIARAVAEEYDVPVEQARQDVDAYLAELQAEGMLQPPGDGDSPNAAGNRTAPAASDRPERAGEG